MKGKNKKSNKKVSNKSIKKKSKVNKPIVIDEDKIGKKTDLLNAATIEVIVDSPVDSPVENSDDDEVTVYRDIMSMTDDERNSSDDISRISTIRLIANPPPCWYDNPANVKFKIGQLVVRKTDKAQTVCFLSGPVKKKNYYSIVPSKSLNGIEVNEEDIKIAPLGAIFIRYWDTVPVIKAPTIKKSSCK